MGLIRVALEATSQVISDQYKEFFECPSIPDDILIVKGHKDTSGRTRNNNIDDVISNGSLIVVHKGQAMAIVDNGAVVEFTAEAGPFVYDSSSEPSIFEGSLGKNVVNTFKTIGRRISFGGHTGHKQYVYYFNTKLIKDNLFGTATPITFRAVDRNIGLDIDVSVRCNGVYSYKISDPMLFYTHVCGNVEGDYKRSEIDSMLKTEFISALQPAFAKISEQGIRYSALPGHTMEMADALNEVLSGKWRNLRGLEIVSFGVSSVKASEEDEAMLKELQRNAAFMDPTRAAAHLVGAQASAMQAAANNPNAGPAMAFMGMNMAGQMGGMNAQNLYQMGAQQQAAQSAPAPAAPAAAGWTCACGQSGITGKFCPECGKPRPAAAAGWTCSCGAVNKGKFCSECGKPKPAGTPKYKCDKCGWEPEDPTHPPKFCPECGDPFDEGDIVL